MTEQEINQSSPKWSSNTKLIVGLSVVAAFSLLLVRFLNFIGPLLLIFIITYLLRPLVGTISKRLKMSWRGSVNLVFIILLILIMSSLTGAGVAIVQQGQIIFDVLSEFFTNLPDIIRDLATQVFTIGPWRIDIAEMLAQFNFDPLELSNQILGFVNPIMSRVGDLIGTAASSAASLIGSIVIIMIVSYFLLAEEKRVSTGIPNLKIPGYTLDLEKLNQGFSKIWDAYLRGQIIIIMITIVVYFLMNGMLGLNSALALAILSGLARFVPYLGPFIAWSIAALVALFQGPNYLGIEPWALAIIIVIASILMDSILDYGVGPRLFGDSLGLHPAVILVGALLAGNLIGFIGLMLAAPVMASVQLIGLYAFRKMIDADPWEGWDQDNPGEDSADSENKGLGWIRKQFEKLKALWEQRNEESE